MGEISRASVLDIFLNMPAWPISYLFDDIGLRDDAGCRTP